MDDFGTSFRLANEALSRLHLEYQFKYSRNLTYFRDKMSGQEQAAELLASQVIIDAGCYFHLSFMYLGCHNGKGNTS